MLLTRKHMLLTRGADRGPPRRRPGRQPGARRRAAPCRPWTGARSCAARASASASASRPSQLTLVQKAEAADAPAGGAAKPRSRSGAPCAATARSAARSMRWSRTASGSARSRCSTRRSTSARTAPRAPPLREHGHGEYRLRYPMKLVDGKYEQISWDQALNEISAKMLELKKASGPDSVFVVGSSQAQQRAVLPAAQVGEPVGQQQLRPPGAHLPLHHGRRRGEHVGLRRDDQFVQRHAATPSARCTSARTPPRRTRCRCCTCCTPRKPAAR